MDSVIRARRELRRIFDAWPHVMRRATDERAREFAFSIWRQSGEPGWRPTVRQLRLMRRMERELAAQDDDEIFLMEGGNH